MFEFKLEWKRLRLKAYKGSNYCLKGTFPSGLFSRSMVGKNYYCTFEKSTDGAGLKIRCLLQNIDYKTHDGNDETNLLHCLSKLKHGKFT